MVWAPDYVQPQELKNYLGISENNLDVFIGYWITTASRNVDDFCGRQFGQVAVAEARTYTPVWDRHLGKYVTEIDDLQDLTDLAIEDANGNAVTAYTFEPTNALQKGRPYERLVTTARTGDLTPTARWGWSAVPAAVKVGLLLQAGRLNARKDSPFGIAGSPQEGSELRLLAQLDPDFRTSLKPFVRKWWAA